MDTDALLELLGIRPREVKSAEPNRQPANPDDSLMDIVRRNQQGGIPAQVAGDLAPVDAQINNLDRELQVLANEERQALARTADQAHRAQISQTSAEVINERRRRTATGQSQYIPFVDPSADLVNSGPGPVPGGQQYASLDRGGGPFVQVGPQGSAPTPAPAPRPAPAPAPSGPSAPQYAHLDRAGPPLQPASAPAPQPIPARPEPTTPFIDITRPAPQVNRPPMMPQLPANPIITGNAGRMQTMPPPDPFMELNPTVGATPAPISHPAPQPDYLVPNNRRPVTWPAYPFTEPSAVMRLAMPAAEGGSMLDRAAPETPTPFAPEGSIINWWNSNRGPAPTARQAAPQTQPYPTPAAPGPDMSTLLNQQELERFLAANGGPPAAPPAQPQQTPPVAAAPPPAPTAPAPGATTMTPPAPPAAGNSISPALQEQLLAEAYRQIASRNQPQQLGPR